MNRLKKESVKKESVKKESVKKESAKNILSPIIVPQAKEPKPVEPIDHKIEDFGSTIKESIDIIKEFNLLTVLGDPMAIIMVIGFLFTSYLYLANNLMYLIVGLLAPSYFMSKKIAPTEKTEKTENFLPIQLYFIVYAHLEFIWWFFGLFGLQFIHLKIMIVTVLVYLAQYQESVFKKIYHQIIFYDEVTIELISKLILRIQNEFQTVRNEQLKKIKKIE